MYVPITNPDDQKRVAEILREGKELKNISTIFVVLCTLCFIGILFFDKVILLLPEFAMAFIMGRIYKQMKNLRKELQEIIIRNI